MIMIILIIINIRITNISVSTLSVHSKDNNVYSDHLQSESATNQHSYGPRLLAVKQNNTLIIQ